MPLHAPKGTDVRPTTDKIKETLFNMLQYDVPGAVFVDCFAGSGAIGIEALSRGAEKAVFVDHNRDAIACIEENLKRCHLEENAQILKMESAAALPSIRRALSDDLDTVYFMDPPYDKGLELTLIRMLTDNAMIRPGDLLVLETSLKEEGIRELPDFLKNCGLEITKDKRYKNQRHVFIRKVRPEA